VMHTDAKPTVPLLGAGVLRAAGKVNRRAEVITLTIKDTNTTGWNA
jgi:hypothetical protein